MAEDFANEDLEAADFTDTEHDGSEEGDDELKDVEEMIQQASEELQKVADENQRLITTLDEGEDVVNVTNPEEGESDEPKQPLGEGLAEEKSERFRQICSLLKKHPNCARCSVLSAELGAAYTTNKPLRWSLVVNHMNSDHPSATRRRTVQAQVGTVPIQKRKFEAIPIARKLSQSYNMQEKLVNENASLEDTRYRLQSNLIDKDRTVECLQRQLCSLQTEMRMVHQENVVLNEKLQHCPNASCPKNSRSNSPTREGGGTGVKMSCGPGKGLCPADVENRLQEYSQTTNQLEKQLVDVEQDVKIIQQELLEVQKEREHLEHHRKMLALSPPCHPSPCPSPYPSCKPYPPCGHPPCPTLPCCPSEASGEDQPFKEMKEKYARLQEDFKAKLTEVAGLRADNEKLKELADKAEENRAKLDMKVKELEKKLKELRGDAGDKGIGSREQLIDLQQQLKVHKELYRQAQDELEELRALVEDIQGQLNDYRNKYLEAIQTIEEQRRQIEIMRMENNRISEQVNLEIVRVKNQFQEKLQELAPLPDILKATQVKLQEAQQMHLLAERNNEAMNRELQSYKDKLKVIMDEMALADDDKATGAGEKDILAKRLKEMESALQEARDENGELLMEIEQIRETADENKRMADEKLHEIAQLETQLESVREESARQVTRIKDRCEIVRKSTQNQVSDLERQLAQTRACAKQAEKERDDVRQKMQLQIRNLNENFEDAQMRIRNLQVSPS
ncbi:cingulin [Dendroctonus ponderosae]|uniref:cingulin n=1 Tax=Dendroctonus ponderosae TaxID=77166 RepID=UPI0020359748|nr:cingulin [Dendroctonus ponderosae]